MGGKGMAKEIKGKDGKTYVLKSGGKKPWYKRWWVWSIIAVVVIGIFAIISSGSDDGDDSSSQTAEKNYIRLDGQKIHYTDSKKFKINSTDNSWSNATVKINSVTVYKLEKGIVYGTKRGKKPVQGMLAINTTVKALKDIDASMDTATVSIPSINEQHDVETKDEWDEIDKGISKTGTIYIPITKLSNTKEIKQLRLKFDCQTDSDDENIDNVDHTYNIVISLN